MEEAKCAREKEEEEEDTEAQEGTSEEEKLPVRSLVHVERETHQGESSSPLEEELAWWDRSHVRHRVGTTTPSASAALEIEGKDTTILSIW